MDETKLKRTQTAFWAEGTRVIAQLYMIMGVVAGFVLMFKGLPADGGYFSDGKPTNWILEGVALGVLMQALLVGITMMMLGSYIKWRVDDSDDE